MVYTGHGGVAQRDAARRPSMIEGHTFTGCAYHQQPYEPELWFQRFQAFLLLGPERTVQKAADAMGFDANKSRGWYAASKEYRWKERAAVYDREFLARVQDDIEAERASMLKRHAMQAQTGTELAMKVIQRAVDLCDAGGLDTLSLTPRQFTTVQQDGTMVRVRSEGVLPLLSSLVRALGEMQKAERVARGEPETTSSVQVSGPGGVPLQGGIAPDDAALIFQKLDAMAKARYGEHATTPESLLPELPAPSPVGDDADADEDADAATGTMGGESDAEDDA
jgi:hypothetical protein